MGNVTDAAGAIEKGATVVITHRVRSGVQAEYEVWLSKIGPICKTSSGLINWQIVRPIADLTSSYTVVIQYDSREHLEAWMCSDERKRLIDEVRPLLATDDDFFIRSGLDFWFTPTGASAKVPVRWKQFLITWSAIYPLVIAALYCIPVLLRQLGVAHNIYLDTFVVTGIVVLLMVYVVMPRYTRWVCRWLFN